MTDLEDVRRAGTWLEDAATHIGRSTVPVRKAFADHLRSTSENLYHIWKALDNGSDEKAEELMRAATPIATSVESMAELVESIRLELARIEEQINAQA